MKKFSQKQIDELLNKKSGLLGISGISNDVRDLIKSKSKKAELALAVFCYRVVKYIGAYTAAMNGVDAIVFTAGIGEKAHYLRKGILDNFGFLNLRLDEKKNKNNELIVTKPDSKVKVLVIKTDEEFAMLKEILKII